MRWYAEMPPSPVLCMQPAIAAPLLSASTALAESEPKLIAEMLTSESGRNFLARSRGPPRIFADGSGVSSPTLRVRRRHHVGERAVLDDRVALGVLDVVVGAEREVVVLQLRRGVDPPPLVPAERPLVVVVGDDVLPQLGADRLEPVAEVADHREVPQDRVLLLRQVLGGQPGDGGRRAVLDSALVHFMACPYPDRWAVHPPARDWAERTLSSAGPR